MKPWTMCSSFSKDEQRDLFAGRQSTEEVDHALAREGLVGGVGIEQVEENDVEGVVAAIGREV